jgi:hypothetical protein
MNQPSQSFDSTFVEFGSAPLPQQMKARNDGNVFKNIQTASVQFDAFSHQNAGDCEPVVNIIRDGDKLISVEFVCTCGNAKMLTFDYDEE